MKIELLFIVSVRRREDICQRSENLKRKLDLEHFPGEFSPFMLYIYWI